MAQTSENEKNHVFSQIRRLMELFDSILVKLNNISNKKLIDDNTKISIALNNKIVELYHYYGNRGLDFFDSDLYHVTYNYIYEMFAEGLVIMRHADMYMSAKFKTIKSAEEYDKIIEDAKAILEPYNKLYYKIYNFNINDNIKEAVEYDIKFSKVFSHNGVGDKYSGHENEISTRYNEELKKLGLSVRITIPEDERKSTNLTPSQEASYEKLQEDYDTIVEDLAIFKI